MHERVQSSPGTTIPDIKPQHGRPPDPFDAPLISLAGERGMRNYRRRFPIQIVLTNRAEIKHLWSRWDEVTLQTHSSIIYNRDSDNSASVMASKKAIDLFEASLEQAWFEKE